MMRMYRDYGGVSQLMGIVSFFFLFSEVLGGGWDQFVLIQGITTIKPHKLRYNPF